MKGRARSFTEEAPYDASGFFALRTPILPIEEWLALSIGLQAPSVANDEGPALASALESDRGVIRDRLRRLFRRPEVREAIFLASPSLVDALERWQRAPEHEVAAERSLLRYVTRMATRPTPFGLFAGYSTGSIGERTQIELAANGDNRRRCRLDMEYIAGVSSHLEQLENVRETLLYRPNSSLYEAGGRLRYAADRREGRARTYHLVAVDPSEALLSTLERAETGAPLSTLSAALVGPGVTRADADAFVGALVEHRILVSNLEPVLTGKNALEALVDELEGRAATERQVAVLSDVRERLAAIDAAPPSGDLDEYRDVATQLAVFPVDASLRSLFQVDVEKRLRHGTLGQAVLRELRRAITLLHALTPPRPDPLAAFRTAFIDRYDAEEVPLVEALDDDVGIGFGRDASEAADESPLIAGLGFPSRGGSVPESLSPRDARLSEMLERCWRERLDVLELSADDVSALSVEDPPPLPDALAVMAAVVAEPGAERPSLLLHSVTGPSGARMLGRFTSADPELEARVREHLAAEEAARPDAVFAEIVCQPQDRVGNVLARAVLRGHEIPFLGRSGATPDRQIPVTDLRLRLERGRIVLRSARLGREVVPRLSTAHYHQHGKNPSVYRFLAALQGQGVSTALAFSWGAHENAVCLPRVVHENFILARARWVLSERECSALSKATGVERHRALRALRENRRLPRHVVLVDDDNELVLDLENVACVDVLFERARQGATLAEWIPGAEEAFARGPEGRFAHEIVVPFVRRAKVVSGDETSSKDGGSTRTSAVSRASRTFAPGSEWLYVKLYGGESSADRVLGELVAPLKEQALSRGVADSWFFLRYADPEPHLRLRFHGDAGRLAGELLPLLHERTAPLLASRNLYRVDIGTYEREIERYGGLEGVAVAERVFRADSEVALAIATANAGDEGSDLKWRLVLAGMHAYFDDFGVDVESRLPVIERLRGGFVEEFAAGGALMEDIRDRFRKERARVAEAIESLGATGARSPEVDAIARRSAELAPLVRELEALRRRGRLTCSIDDHLVSYVHLFVNRALRSSPRAHEFVLYEFLFAHYRSVLGKRRAERRSGGR
ncbi:MAG TPA: lantibiotic dehydratase [Polyangiaceae bacterium]|nr:lantibiotic dehydratase [Polyangiaceae bacterium]